MAGAERTQDDGIGIVTEGKAQGGTGVVGAVIRAIRSVGAHQAKKLNAVQSGKGCTRSDSVAFVNKCTLTPFPNAH